MEPPPEGMEMANYEKVLDGSMVTKEVFGDVVESSDERKVQRIQEDKKLQHMQILSSSDDEFRVL